ncbi:hypothetical protein AB0K48_09430 [Nonomuraea sp. NPDC055795]
MEPYQFYAPIPASTASAQAIKDWFYRRRTQVSALAVSYTPHSTFSQDAMEALEKKLRSMESFLANKGAPATAVDEFGKWLASNSDYGAWDYYVADQQAKDLIESDRQAQAMNAAAINDAKNRASGGALALSRQNAAGMMSLDKKNGRVISGLAVVGDAAQLYTGISGKDKHGFPDHPLIARLLEGTHQAMDWPQESCAEVDALKKYLHAQVVPVTALNQIPRNTLVFNALVWHPGGNWEGKVTSQRWQPRSACANCDQWLRKIGALRS